MHQVLSGLQITNKGVSQMPILLNNLGQATCLKSQVFKMEMIIIHRVIMKNRIMPYSNSDSTIYYVCLWENYITSLSFSYFVFKV